MLGGTALMPISALRAERAVKPFVLGRNYELAKAMCRAA